MPISLHAVFCRINYANEAALGEKWIKINLENSILLTETRFTRGGAREQTLL
jgi:hypothetical protein